MAKKRSWNQLESSEKLGYYWVGSFFFLMIATFLAIMVPIYFEWMEELQHIEEEEGRHAPRAIEYRLASQPENPLNGIIRPLDPPSTT